MNAFAIALSKAWFSVFGSETAPSIITSRRKVSKGLSGLYVLHVDHPVSPEMKQRLEQALDSLREKYDIDFVVLEPGIRLKRFEDI